MDPTLAQKEQSLGIMRGGKIKSFLSFDGYGKT